MRHVLLTPYIHQSTRPMGVLPAKVPGCVSRRLVYDVMLVNLAPVWHATTKALVRTR